MRDDCGALLNVKFVARQFWIGRESTEESANASAASKVKKKNKENKQVH